MISFKHVHPLPARAVPLPGESLTSLLRRTAEVMEYSGARQILSLVAAKLKGNPDTLAPGPEMTALAELLRTSAAQMTSMTVHHVAEQLVLLPHDSDPPTTCDGMTIARYFAVGACPVCPKCLAEDSEPYERLLWTFRPLPVCLIHESILILRCLACGRPLRRNRPRAAKCRCGCDLRENKQVALPPTMVEHLRSIERWLIAKKSPIAGLSVAGCFFWADQLAHAINKTTVWVESLTSAWQLPAATPRHIATWAGAAEILEHWPHRFYQFLEAFQRVPKHGRHSTGTTMSFGHLPVLASKLERLGYAAPADALREYLLERFTAGQLTHRVALFRGHDLQELLDRRPWMTHTEAARWLGVRHAAIADLIGRGVLVGEVRPAGKSRRLVGVVSRTSLERLRRDLRDSCNCHQAAKRLGVFHKTVWQMAQEGLLERAVRTAEGWRIPRSSLTALLERFRSRPAAVSTGDGWITFRQAVRQLGSSSMTVLELLRDLCKGVIQSQWDAGHHNLHAIVVDREDLSAAMDRAREKRRSRHGYSLSKVGQAMFPDRTMTFRAMRRWLQIGLLRARQEGHQWVISPEEVQRIRTEYCLSAEACRILGISRSTLVHWRAQGKLEPIYGRGAKIAGSFCLFRRNDILRLKPTHKPQEAS